MSPLTPIENAYELLGLHQSYILLHDVFLGTMLWKIVFLLGFLLAFIRVLKKSKFQYLLVYSFAFLSCVFLFMIPSINIKPAGCMSENQEYHNRENALKTEDVLKVYAVGNFKANPLMHLVLKSINSLLNIILSLLDRFRIDRIGFVMEPFQVFNVQERFKERISQGIIDPDLRFRVVEHYHQFYFPVLSMLQNEGASVAGFWAGDEQVILKYPSEGRTNWERLRVDLREYLDINHDLSFFEKFFYAQKKLDGPAVKDLLLREERIRSLVLTQTHYTSLSSLNMDRSSSLTGSVIAMRPYLYGALLWGMWFFSSFILVWVALTGDFAVFAHFFKYALIIKLFPVLWSIVDLIGVGVLHSLSFFSSAPCCFWQLSAPGNVVALGIVVAPILLISAVMVIDFSSMKKLKEGA